MNTKPAEEELCDMIEKGMSLYKISRKYGTTIPAIFQLEKDYGIIPKTFILKKCYHISKEDLESMYIDEGMRQCEIAEEIGYSGGHVSKMLSYYHIPTRGHGKYNGRHRSLVRDNVVQMFKCGKSIYQITKEVGYSHAHVFRILQEHGISGMAIPGMLGAHRSIIPMHREWRQKVLERDNFTCQLCGSQENPEVHHICRYVDCPERRFDVDNGVTLCKSCHHKVTGHEYEYAQYFLDIIRLQYREYM